MPGVRRGRRTVTCEKGSESIAVRGMLETTKGTPNRSYRIPRIGIPVRNLRNYGIYYGMRNPRIVQSVCCRTRRGQSASNKRTSVDSAPTAIVQGQESLPVRFGDVRTCRVMAAPPADH